MIMNELYIDNYKIILNEILGKGVYGTVYGCRSLTEPQLLLCAKKMMISDKSIQTCAEREKQISEIISQHQSNQNIVKVYYVKYLPEQKVLIIIMEKCDANLKQYLELKDPKTFSENEFLDFLDQFLTGYSFLFDRDIIHRDIKPENILIKREKKIIYKLSDFGTAKIYKANDFEFTKIGTPAYVAPEINSQLNDCEVYNNFVNLKKFQHSKSQVDVYSLGLILYEMTYGKLPFEKRLDSIVDFAQKIKANPLILPGASKFKEIIAKMLVYYPDQRLSFEYLYKFVKDYKKESGHCPSPIQFKIDIGNCNLRKNIKVQNTPFSHKINIQNNPNQINQPHIQPNPHPFQQKPNQFAGVQNHFQPNQAPNQNLPPPPQQIPDPIQIQQPIRSSIPPQQKIKEYMQFILQLQKAQTQK
ncbi:unnamed protein product (macronuclear) [Paramecium tetraurelia]|uniref:Protein kinase domain-containing protein n=1 Tax=Paramecium tetraurelia TaxID=5888 RepID=A0CJ20_PARTE|nr:uncharacterized protein GSPATT00007922001 [Paramecium tetraurelia]CAK70787.1 unnamed protein product [Paramecium tetraurelia]|eukprot:XP_001438184.1 hypothetical protein (macronuclear) [Paramecium tetraurelia strain d4-2]